MALVEKTKTVVTNRRRLKVVGSPTFGGMTSTLVIGGQIVAIGAIVEVSMHEATELMGRGVAVDATPAEVTAAGANLVVAPSRNDSWTDAA